MIIGTLIAASVAMATPKAINCRSIQDPNVCLQYAPWCQWDDTEPPGEQCEPSHHTDFCSQFDFNPTACLNEAPFCKWDQQEQHCERAD